LTDAPQSAKLVALADRIELWPIDHLRLYQRNRRTHSETQVDQIAASMVEFGWTNPILIDENAAEFPRSCTPCSGRLQRPAAMEHFHRLGQAYPSPSGMPTTNASTSRYFTAGKRAATTIDAAHATRATCGSSTSPPETTCTPP
jgi:hypothetical protein